jgi:hypothetical protein
MCYKIILSVVLVVIFFNKTYAQKDNAYQSSFYTKPIGPVSSIVFLYRPELYKKSKALEKFKTTLLRKCKPHNLNIYFANIGTDEADSLIHKVDFICKITFTKYIQRNPFLMTSIEFITKKLSPRRDKEVFIFGYKNINMQSPDWNCSCKISSDFNNYADDETAICFYERLIHDGIIKEIK